MKKKAWFVWMVVALACSSLMLMTSCAKKQVGVGETEVSQQAGAEEEGGVPSDEGYDEREKQRQAELEALQAEYEKAASGKK